MSSYVASLPSLKEFFPPTPRALVVVQTVFKSFLPFSIVQWFAPPTPMGRSSPAGAWLNLPGRYAWSLAEAAGPLNLIYILYSLPAKLHPLSSTTTTISPSTGLFGTGLPITHEIMGLLYVLHYINRAGVTPLFLAPSMSPIWAPVALMMAVFQFLNSSSLGGWICYDAQKRAIDLSSNRAVDAALISPLSVLGMILFVGGLAGNISAEGRLFDLRRGAATRKAKSEGKATVTYDKVYTIPEPKGLFKYVMYPHYSLEWVEWTGYWILGGAWGLGWSWNASAALMFLANELASMTPRGVDGVKWYEQKFGKRAVAGRKGVIPGII